MVEIPNIFIKGVFDMNENEMYETEVMTEVSSGYEAEENNNPEDDFMALVADSDSITENSPTSSGSKTNKVIAAGIVGLAIVGGAALIKAAWNKGVEWKERRKAKKLKENINTMSEMVDTMVDTVCEEHKES